DPGAFPDAGADGRRLHRRRGAAHLRLLPPCAAPAGGGGRGRGPARSGDVAAMSRPAREQAAPLIRDEPYYLPSGNEVAVFEQCHARALAVMLKGPTGCGKTRFVEYMAWKLGRPLITVSCHDDLTASDLVGRFLIHHDGTVWQD